MKVLSVQSFHNKTNNLSVKNQPNKIGKSNNNVSFYGKYFPNAELDMYLKNLEAHRNLFKDCEIQINNARKIADDEINKVNEQIKETIVDEDFLWSVTTEKLKHGYSAFIVKNVYQCGKNMRDSWDLIINKVKKHILSDNPNTILEELSEVEQKGVKPEDKPLLDKLKTMLISKSEIEKSYNKNATNIYHENLEKRSNLQIKPKQLYIKHDPDNYYSDIKQRAAETGKYPELEQIFSDKYQERLFINQKLNFESVDAVQDAVKTANRELFEYLQYGTPGPHPF